MDVSMQLRDLASAVGDDFALNAPDDASRLVRRARRGRMVWTTGVGTAVVGSAATLAFGGPALATVLTTGPDVAPASSTSILTSESATPTPSDDVLASEDPTESAEPGENHESTGTPGAGVIDLSGGVSGSDDDNGTSDESGDSDSDSDQDQLRTEDQDQLQEQEQEHAQEQEQAQEQEETQEQEQVSVEDHELDD